MAKKRGSKHMHMRLKVKEVAERQGKSRTWLSYHAQVQYDTLTRLYNNPETDVALSTLLKIARALQVDVSELYEQIPDE